MRIVSSLQFIILCFVLIAFSTDIRISSTLSIDPNASPNFQIFEFLTIPLLLLLIYRVIFIRKVAASILKADAFIFLFISWAVLISLFAFNPAHALSRSKDFFVAWVLFFSFRELTAVQIYRLIKFSVILAGFWSIFGIMQMLGLDPWFGSPLGALFRVAVNWKTVVDPFTGAIKSGSFAQGIYLYPQNFSYYLIMPLFMSAWLVSKHKAWLPVFAVILIAIIGSGSKTFYLLGSLVLLWVTLRNIKVDRLTTLMIIACSIMVVTIFALIYIRPAYFFSAVGTFIWRIDQWTDTTNMLSSIPYVVISGHGTEYLEKIYSRFHYPNPHNAFLYFLIEYGLIGLVLFACFLYSILGKGSFRYRKLRVFPSTMTNDARTYGAERFIFSGLLFTLSMTIVDDYFVQTQLTAIFMFYMGMFYNLLIKRNRLHYFDMFLLIGNKY